MKVHPLCSPGWRPLAPASLTPNQKYWLFRPGALTAGLRSLGVVKLRVLAEYPQGAPPDEAVDMGIAPRSPAWVREVIMSVNGIDCVVARSLTPLPASHAQWQGMRRLMTRPLADMLYHDCAVLRSPFTCRRLTRGIPLHRVASANAAGPGELWARRSVFWRHGQPLLVAECFLPPFWRVAQPR